ncbi:M20/M25/M40 family metallo-hydrolase [Reichenbachiella carrageenanivorans]|uniref:M20/M25/M40 family metallo-hydrolase n=1 Tax=Reichenbachiella carrageenanivorans TaxID=2979869 RepID=A0ABY6D2A5_9BACT|nr:M20/M25/M40 family metallo-hydrolase [Reichenbachiella carrageenanivorans]UXX80258.1 M20/M25/M40 family metallo-hydrolase [Reichenbachiella carrageenanivorans]
MQSTDVALLKTLCGIFAPSGNESSLTTYLIDYVNEHKATWKVQPELIYGDEFQDCLILKFGQPKTAIFAHLDSIGFTVRYENQLVPIGGPETETGYILVGQDSMGPIECKLKDEDGHLFYDFGRGIESGTDLVFKSDFRETKDYVQSCYMDNRLGVYNALKVAETLENGLIIFSCWEEHGGGTVPFLCKWMYENHQIKQALVSDITWITEGVTHGNGVAISLRDMSIPRREYVDKIVALADASGINYQIEVERSGGSDGREIQLSPYPIDWCFVGAPEDNVHSPDEIVHKADIDAMVSLYQYLMKNL